MVSKYIENLTEEIEEIICKEVSRPQLFFEDEKRLHVLFENLKHAKEFAAMKKD